MDKKQVVEQIKKLIPLFSKCINLHYLVLFGSYAKGTQHEWSDIDLAIVANNLPRGLINRDILQAMVEASKINNMFEPHFFRTEKWENPTYGSFVEYIKKYGEVIYSNGSK